MEPHLRDPSLLVLRNARVELGPCPEAGGSISHFVVAHEDGTARHWFRPATASAVSRRDGHDMACFPLVPVSGRIGGAVLRFAGDQYLLPRNHLPERSHPHGEGWRAAWGTEPRSGTEATLTLSGPVAGWPFPYEAWQRFTLLRKGFRVEIDVRNSGQKTMPAATGLHPWFPAPLGHLRARVDTAWMIDGRKLFRGTVPVPERCDSPGRRGLAGSDLEHGLTGWDGEATIWWPGQPEALRVSASDTLRHLVIYTRHYDGSFCVEPVSCSVDAFNLAERGVAGNGTVVLEPGAALIVWATFQVFQRGSSCNDVRS